VGLRTSRAELTAPTANGRIIYIIARTRKGPTASAGCILSAAAVGLTCGRDTTTHEISRCTLWAIRTASRVERVQSMSRTGLIACARERMPHPFGSASTVGGYRASKETPWHPRCSRTAFGWCPAAFKFHRPRGIFSADTRSLTQLVQLHSGARTIPASRDAGPAIGSLEVSSHAGWPSVSHDALRAIDFRRSVSRRASTTRHSCGRAARSTSRSFDSSRASAARPPAGPRPLRDAPRALRGAGCAAARVASRPPRWRRKLASAVILVEQDESRDEGCVVTCKTFRNVQVLRCTTAVAYYDHDLVALAEVVPNGGRTFRRAFVAGASGSVVLATGALEQPLSSQNNDRPGIMLAGAALKFLRRHATLPAGAVLGSTNNDSPTLRRVSCGSGCRYQALVDSRSAARIPRTRDESPRDAVAVAIDAIDTRLWRAQARNPCNPGPGHGVMMSEHLPCDALLVRAADPTLQLFARPVGAEFSDSARTFEPAAAVPNIEIVGSAGKLCLKISASGSARSATRLGNGGSAPRRHGVRH